MKKIRRLSREQALRTLAEFHQSCGRLKVDALVQDGFEGATEAEILLDWIRSQYGASPNPFLGELVEFATGDQVDVHGLPDNLGTCPCCGFKTLTEARGDYEVCRLCNWEDTGSDHPGGCQSPNKGSMYEYRHLLSQRGKSGGFHRWQCGPRVAAKDLKFLPANDELRVSEGADHLMQWASARATAYLTETLQLPARGDEQDWEIELADEARLEEFISLFPDLASDDEYAYAMVALIIASFDDRLGQRLYPFGGEYIDQMREADFDVSRMYTQDERRLWLEISRILNSRVCLFDWLIRYWSSADEPESAFACTLFFRTEFRTFSR
ncbi:CPCC family cysteine-rich protein [Labrenzia sp. VG12]|uniref:CPCC family cysteine-rich protein n=1 Tax=Labrenzia sp. VG12 TaxID=2021862 RepID=UPI000B8C5FF0|nr:CPCC family cysteine-rich protein [Labrenzia sp. VG12]ASP34348.1 hypothetical protein CHH27_14750 [Labrenzia sp. VG12]